MSAALVATLLTPLFLGAAEPTVEELLRTADDMLRGTSSTGTMTMHVKTARWERSLTLQVWSQGTDRTLIRILAPAKEKGTATLKVADSIWNYLPNVDRTIKVPASMMSGAWMGSHFTNDDLVRSSRFSRDFQCRLLPHGAGQPLGVECIPKPDAPVVWGKVVLEFAASDRLPRKAAYFDEKGALVRTMAYSDVALLGGRTVPRRVTLTPADKPGEFTEISYSDMSFDVPLPESTFTLQALRR